MNSWSVSYKEPQSIGSEVIFRSSIWTDSNKSLTVSKISNALGDYSIVFWGVAEAFVSMSKKYVQLFPVSNDVSFETLEHILLDQIIPRILAHEGKLVLHAGAVSQRGTCIAFLGDSGRGKSTLTASLLVDGWSLMGDDAVVVSDKGDAFFGSATYDSLRLLPDSISGLSLDGSTLTAVADYTQKKRVVTESKTKLGNGIAALQAFFFLAAESADNRIELRRMSLAESCMGLISNSFALDPTDKELAESKLNYASSLTSTVPAFELSFPRDYARLPDVHEAIRAKLSIL